MVSKIVIHKEFNNNFKNQSSYRRNFAILSVEIKI